MVSVRNEHTDVWRNTTDKQKRQKPNRIQYTSQDVRDSTLQLFGGNLHIQTISSIIINGQCTNLSMFFLSKKDLVSESMCVEWMQLCILNQNYNRVMQTSALITFKISSHSIRFFVYNKACYTKITQCMHNSDVPSWYQWASFPNIFLRNLLNLFLGNLRTTYAGFMTCF